MEFSLFERALDRQPVLPVYVFSGEEDFFFRQGLALLRKRLEREGAEFERISLEGTDQTAEQVLDEFQSLGFLGRRKLVVLREGWELLEQKASQWEELFARSGPHVLAVLESRWEARSALAQRVRAQGSVIECRRPKDWDVPTWLRKRAREKGIEISPEAVQELVSRTGNRLLLLDSALDTLLAYVGERQTIERADVLELCPADRAARAFALVDAVSRRDEKAALGILGDLYRAGEDPQRLLGLLLWHFRRLAAACGKDKDSWSDSWGGGRPDRFAELAARTPARRSIGGGGEPRAVGRAVSALLEADGAAKSGLYAGEFALELAVLKLCREGAHGRPRAKVPKAP